MGRKSKFFRMPGAIDGARITELLNECATRGLTRTTRTRYDYSKCEYVTEEVWLDRYGERVVDPFRRSVIDPGSPSTPKKRVPQGPTSARARQALKTTQANKQQATNNNDRKQPTRRRDRRKAAAQASS